MQLTILPSQNAPAIHVGGTFRVALILPPDLFSPARQRLHRMPPQGAAMVAAAVGPDGIHLRVTDLTSSVTLDPPRAPLDALADEPACLAHLTGTPNEPLEALVEELLGRVDLTEADAVAFSLDRQTQSIPAVLLALAVKRRFGLPTLVGGIFVDRCLALIEGLDLRGVDLVSVASSPPELRRVFSVLRDVPRGRFERAVDPIGGQMPVEIAPDDWPLPDFSVFDLEPYRRDPFADERRRLPGYDGSGERHLVLPYHFTFDCQYFCSFCQRGGKQTGKRPENAVRDLATLAEKYGTRDFFFVDSQINLHAVAFARALADARLGLRWSDSFRAMPRKPGDMELMRESGCVGLTFGLESASTRILKRMVKGHLPHHGTRVVRDAHANEILTRVNLLTCFPGETREDFELTRDWVAEHAPMIDELAPSSFYLAPGSPLSKDPERYGIRFRETRVETGDYKFRKPAGALMFDEIGGYTWEEREPLLRATENELRAAWRDHGGPQTALDGMHPRLVFAVRRRFETKAEAWKTLVEWHRARGAEDRAEKGTGTPDVVALASVATPRLVGEHDDGVSSRFDAVVKEALPDLTRFLGPTPAGHVVLFEGGDYLFFRGTVEPVAPAEGASVVEARIDSVLTRRLDDPSRRGLYGRLSPGAVVTVSPNELAFASGPPVPLARGREYHLLAFASRR